MKMVNRQWDPLQNVLATELLLGLLHDLQELLEGDTAIARDIGLVDNLIDISLRERAVAKVLEGSAELGRGNVARTVLVDVVEQSTVGLIGGLGSLVVLGHQGGEGLEVQGLGGELDVLGQLGVVEELDCKPVE